MAGYRFWCFAVFLSGAPLTTVLLSDARAGDEPTLPASRSSRATSVESIAPFITEASCRSAIPAQWIREVMQLESSGNGRAISPKGAVGLMQIMPGTWVELSVRYGLGIHPFDPHDNIMAGAAYLCKMHDRCGSAGFLAAYHARPLRYEQHFVTGKPLPSETTAYVATAHHCWTTSRVNMPQLSAGVHLHGGRLPCCSAGGCTMTDIRLHSKRCNTIMTLRLSGLLLKDPRSRGKSSRRSAILTC